jgi:hypothetical protein
MTSPYFLLPTKYYNNPICMLYTCSIFSICIHYILMPQAFYPCLQSRCIPIVCHLYSHASKCSYINRYILSLIAVMRIINFLMCSYLFTYSRRSSNSPNDSFLIAHLGCSPTTIFIHYRSNKLTLHIFHPSYDHEESYTYT